MKSGIVALLLGAALAFHAPLAAQVPVSEVGIPQVRAIAVQPFFRDTGALGAAISEADGPIVNQTVAGHVVREYLLTVTIAAQPDRDLSAAPLDLKVTERGRARPWLRAKALAVGTASPSGEVHVPVLVTLRPCESVKIAATPRGGAAFAREIDFVCQN